MNDKYVSISGISNSNELEGIKKIYDEENCNFPLVIGYQLSNKSITFGTRNPRQPFFCELSNLDKQTQAYGFITALHYYTGDNQTILGDVEKILTNNINPTLIQFNTLPPSQRILGEVKNFGIKIIMPLALAHKNSLGGFKIWAGENAEDVSSGDINPLINCVYERRNLIDYIMFDPSHGNNLELDLTKNSLAVRFGEAITSEKEFDHLGLVYAGGIRPTNVCDISRLLEGYFPNRTSIDTEGGIRTDNILNLDLVRGYLVGYRDGVEKQ